MDLKVTVEGKSNWSFQTTISGVPVQTGCTIDYAGITPAIANDLFWNGFKLKMQTVLRTMRPDDVKAMFATGKTVSWRECLSKNAAKERMAVDNMTKAELAAHIAELQKRLETADDDESDESNADEYTVES